MKKRRSGSFFRRATVWFLIAFILLLLTLFVVGVGAVYYVESTTEAHLDFSQYSFGDNVSGSTLYYYEFSDRTNRIGESKILTTVSATGRGGGYVTYENMPQDIIDAFVAIEDKHFWTHRGVDWPRTAAAAANYVFKYQNTFGASTITQQLIKNITGEDEQTPQRKLQEARWALDLEQQMDKREIIELYLNIINLGQGCFGVQSAARTYFSKNADELTLLECVSIAAITKNPSKYNPISHPKENRERSDIILSQMYEQGLITEEEYHNAVQSDLTLNPSQDSTQNDIHSWYVDMVIEDVIKDLCEIYDCSTAAASMMLYYGGLHIYTAIDPEIQSIMESYYLRESHFQDAGSKNPVQSAMIVIDPQTGDILGVVGARGKKTGNRVQNYATSTKRPAGSSIKPLSVYAPALQNGLINYATVFDDVPVKFNTSKSGKLVGWPKNSPNVYRGLVNINHALELSINTVSVRVLEKLTPQKSFQFLHDSLQMHSLIERQETEAGILTDIDYAALALGQQNYGVTVREITGAYSILANHGIFNCSRSYLTVRDRNGNTILSNEFESYPVITEENAFIMTKMLQNVVSTGTAKAITLDMTVPVAGKTGTTQNNADKWFIGYTPYLIGGVWMGYDYPKSLDAFEGNPCVDIWDAVMRRLHQRFTASGTVAHFETPSNILRVTYCKDSGKLMSPACYADPRGSRAEVGYFVTGTQPTTYCNCHTLVDYDLISGGLATARCPADHVGKVGLIRVERTFPIQIYITDAQYVARDADPNRAPIGNPNQAYFAYQQGKSKYFGISKSEMQYNRVCQGHHDPAPDNSQTPFDEFFSDLYEE